MDRALRLSSLLVVSIIVLLAYPALPFPTALGQGSAPGMPATTPVTTQGALWGHILSDVGAPLGGATVTAEDGNGSVYGAQSAPDGSYRIPLAAGLWNVSVGADGHAPLNTSALVAPAGTEQNLTIQHTGSVVRGSITESGTGKAVADAVVTVNGPYGDCKSRPCPMAATGNASDASIARPIYYRPGTSTVTTATGSYAIAVEPGSVGVSASKAGYRDATEQVDATHDARLDLKLLVIPPQSAVLQGAVTDASTGEPVPGAWVNAWPSAPEATMAGSSKPTETGTTEPAGTTSGGGSADAPQPGMMPCYGCDGYPTGNSTQSDSAGRYRMGMYPGTYVMSVGAPDHGGWQQVITLHDGQAATVDAKLDPIPGDTVRIHGKVVDAKTGAPVGGAYISIENPQWGAYNGTQIGRDGAFDLRTKPGWSVVWVRADVYGYPASGGVATDCPPEADCIAPGEPNPGTPPQPGRSYYPWVQGAVRTEGQDVSLAVQLQPKSGADATIKGYVLNATSHRAIPGAWVNLHNEDTGDWGSVQADKDGSFVVLGKAGVHTLNAYADGYYQNATVVTVPEQGLRIDLSLQPGRPSYSCCIAYAEGRGVVAPPPSAGGAAALGGPVADAAASPGAPNKAIATGAPQQQTYAKSGGLGPYDASSAPPPGTGAPPGGTGAQKVPGFEAALGFAAVGLAVLALRRKR